MKWLGRLVMHTLAILVAAYIVPGVHVDGILTSVVVAVVLGIVNAIIKPVLKLLTFPITLLTLGLFSLVINGLMIWLVSQLVSGFVVSSFMSAVLFSVALSVVGWFLQLLAREK